MSFSYNSTTIRLPFNGIHGTLQQQQQLSKNFSQHLQHFQQQQQQQQRFQHLQQQQQQQQQQHLLLLQQQQQWWWLLQVFREILCLPYT